MTTEGNKVTSRICPNCGNTKLVLLSTINRKVCAMCRPQTWIIWHLEKGQKRTGT